MSYTVFALKWRPKDFDEVVGQKHIVATLKNSLQRNRLAHAYLFAGPRGVGKTSTARILAKALNCKDGPTVKPCQKCASCLEINRACSLDVIEIDGASNRGIDEIRVLRENVKFSPVSGKFKVYIIDEVHMLTTEAFNALLKTLEEPPEFVKFIFATTQPHKVPATILSRCHRFDFRRIPAMETVGQLGRIIAEEKIEIDKEVLFAIAKASDGSLRDAESLLDQLSSFSKDKISLRDVVSILGIVEQESLFEITDKLIEKDAPAALGLFDKIIEGGKDINVFLASLIEHFRNLMVAKVAKADSKLLDLPEEACQKLLQQAQGFTLEEIFSAFNILVNTHEMSKRLDSLRIPLEISLVKLAHDKKGVSRNSPVKPAIKAEEAKAVNPSPRPSSNPSPEPSLPKEEEMPREEINSISLDSLKNGWQNIINALAAVKMSVATYLNEGSPIKLNNNVLTVSFPRNYSLHKESLETKENRAVIEKAISQVFNAVIRINFILSEELAQEKDDGGGHAFIKSALEAFKARIIRD